MSDFTLALVAGAATLVLSLLLPFAVRPLLQRLGIMDVPNERSSHDRPVIRGLGLAVWLAMLAGGALALAGDFWGADPHPVFIVTAVSGGLVAGVLGFAEDLRGVRVLVRGLVLLAIGIGAGVALVWAPGSVFASVGFGVGLLLVVYAVLFISSYINVANFMDGLNGISGFHGVIAGATFAVIGGMQSMTWLVAAGLILAAGFLGFLPWNLTKPGAFLGDVGSYLLGGSTATISFAALAAGVPLLATIGPMCIYFGDVGVTMVRRVRRGHRWDEPHKEHVYQRLQQGGLSHVAASGVTALCTLAVSVLGVISMAFPLWGQLLCLAGGLAVLLVYLALPRLLAR